MSDAGQTVRARPATETAEPWHERHHVAWTAIKWVAGTTAGLVVLAILSVSGWMAFDLRDDVRDSTAAGDQAVAERVEIREQVKAVDDTATREHDAIRARVREVETTTTATTEALKWMTKSLERLERAVGTRDRTPPPKLEPAP